MFELDLEIFSNGSQSLTNEEFLSKYRVTRDHLNLVTNLINTVDVFLQGMC